jgi:hypothetical protein
MTAAPTPDRTAVRAALAVLFEPSDVIELRALPKGRKRTDAGYFDGQHRDGLADHAARLSGQGAATYITLNPVDPQLLGRYSNRVQDYADATTTDAQIIRRRWLLIDVDPVRPAKTSSTDAQLEAARVKANSIHTWLKKQGWPAPVVGMSGNGYHLLYAIDLPNDEEATTLVKGALLALADRFDDAQIKVDKSVFNAARICKLYGTVASKGDHTDTAPHRLSTLLKTPPRVVVTPEQLKALAPVAAVLATPAKRPGSTFSLEDFLTRHGLEFTADRHGDSERFKLAVCPFNAEHGHGQAAMFRQSSGKLGFKCQHDSCSGKTWADVRALLDGPPKTRAPVAIKTVAIKGQIEDGAHFLSNDKGILLPCEHNAYRMMATAPAYDGLHFDEFLDRMRIDGRDWSDHDELQTLRWMQSKSGVSRFTLSQVRHAAQSLGFTRRLDSLRDFVNGLPVWDGTPRVALAFISAWGAPDTALMRAASQNFFIALIARALTPGAQVDTVWAFEGPQGKLKSKALRLVGGSLHAEISAPIGTPDFQRELLGIWIAELAELDAMRGREATTIKRLLSAPTDRFVQKYQLHAVSHPRRSVFVATTNEATYWQDSTGARRLVPVPCGELRLDLIEANRLQWLAEARQLHADGSTWWEFPNSILVEQEERQQIDPWEDVIRDFMLKPFGFDAQGQVRSSVVMSQWLDLAPSQQGKTAGTRLGQVMRKLGFKPVRIGKERARGWERADTDLHKQLEVSAEVSAIFSNEADTKDT